MKHEFGALQTLPAAPNAFDFDLIHGFADPGGVDEDYGNSANIGSFFDGVSGGAGNGRDDSASVTEQLVEQARFSGIGSSYNGGPNPVSQNSAFGRSAQQFVHEVRSAFQAVD